MDVTYRLSHATANRHDQLHDRPRNGRDRRTPQAMHAMFIIYSCCMSVNAVMYWCTWRQWRDDNADKRPKTWLKMSMCIVCTCSTALKLSTGRNPHRRTSWKLVGNPGHELVANRPAKSPASHGRLPHFRAISHSPAASLKSPAFLLCRLTKF